MSQGEIITTVQKHVMAAVWSNEKVRNSYDPLAHLGSGTHFVFCVEPFHVELAKSPGCF